MSNSQVCSASSLVQSFVLLWLNRVVWYQLQSKFNLAVFVFSTCTCEHSQHSLRQHFISGRHPLMSSYETLLMSPGASYVPPPRAACCWDVKHLPEARPAGKNCRAPSAEVVFILLIYNIIYNIAVFHTGIMQAKRFCFDMNCLAGKHQKAECCRQVFSGFPFENCLRKLHSIWISAYM